jgi:RNA polymerase-associated protein
MDKLLIKNSSAAQQENRKALYESLVAVSPMFKEMPFFMSEEFSLVDCSIAPLLWRLKVMGIELPAEAKPILEYAKRIFDREAFQLSLTAAERAIGE